MSRKPGAIHQQSSFLWHPPLHREKSNDSRQELSARKLLLAENFSIATYVLRAAIQISSEQFDFLLGANTTMYSPRNLLVGAALAGLLLGGYTSKVTETTQYSGYGSGQ